MRKVVVVAGGAGFIGSNLIENLLQTYDVICIDNFITGSPKNLLRVEKKAKEFSAKFHCLNQDVCKSSLVGEVLFVLENYFNARPVWGYFNLACPASPVAYQKNPILTLDTCYLGTSNAMKFAQMGARVFHASTSEVYGDPEIHPQAETYKGSVNTWGPRACYDEGKRVAETICYEYLAKGYDIRVARIFNTYGPNLGKDDGRVISSFLNQALVSDPITIFGNGSTTRSFCYVEDLVDGIMKLFHLDVPPSGPINLGNEKEFTLNELATLVKELLPNSLSQVIRTPSPPQDDPSRRKPDLGLAYQTLGWSPKVSLREGLKKTISYYLSTNEENEKDS